MRYAEVRPIAIAILTAALEVSGDGELPEDIRAGLMDMGLEDSQSATLNLDVEFPATWADLRALLHKSANTAFAAGHSAAAERYGALIGVIISVFRSLAIEAAPCADARALIQRVAAGPVDYDNSDGGA